MKFTAKNDLFGVFFQRLILYYFLFIRKRNIFSSKYHHFQKITRLLITEEKILQNLKISVDLKSFEDAQSFKTLAHNKRFYAMTTQSLQSSHLTIDTQKLHKNRYTEL